MWHFLLRKSLFLCLYLLLTAMTRHHASDRTKPQPLTHTDLLPQASFVAGFVVPRGHISANLPAVRHSIGFRSPRYLSTYFPPRLPRSIIDRVRRAFRRFVSRITVGWVTHRFHSVTNSVAAAGVISVGPGPGLGNGNGTDFRLSGSVKVLHGAVPGSYAFDQTETSSWVN